MTDWTVRLAQVRLVARAWVSLRRVRSSLGRLPLPGLCLKLGVLPPDAPCQLDASPITTAALGEATAAVRRLDRLGRSLTCLERSLVLGSLLRSYAPILRIGVRKSPELEAHAWIELGKKSIDRQDHLQLRSSGKSISNKPSPLA